MDKVIMGISSIQGSTVKAVLAMLPRKISIMVKDSTDTLWEALSNKWNATCVWDLPETEKGQLTQIDMLRLARALDLHQKRLLGTCFEEYRDLFLLVPSALGPVYEGFFHYMKENDPGNCADLFMSWSKCNNYPHLKTAVPSMLCMPTGSCNVECLFSKLRYLQTPSRSSVSDELLKISAMLFINKDISPLLFPLLLCVIKLYPSCSLLHL